MKLLAILKDKFLLEHLEISEITLDSKNGLDLKWIDEDLAEFTLDDIVYQATFDGLPSPTILPGSSANHLYKGNIVNVGFGEKGDDPYAMASSLPKAGRANIIKIYTTMFKAIQEYAKNNKPDYILLSSYKASGYFPIYNNLTKSNKIVGYQRKMVDIWRMDGTEVQSIVLTRVKK